MGRRDAHGFMLATNLLSMQHPGCEMICTRCGNALIAPEWSKPVGDGRVFNLWACTNCGQCFGEASPISTYAETVDKRKTLFWIKRAFREFIAS